MPAPPPAVIASFGATGEPTRAEGGRGTSWIVGDRVFKPFDLERADLAWQADLYAALPAEGFRVAKPRRAESGALDVDGWCCWERVVGRHEAGRWAEIVAVGELFHASIAGFPRPLSVGRRPDPWSIADRVAWGELPVKHYLHVKHLHRLVAALRPVTEPSQLIHGDLTGNVLFADPLPPAIIDFAPYWRPPAFASAIVVADALVWEGADERVLASVAHVENFPQYLLRALIYRAVTDRLFRPNEPTRPDDADPYLPAVELACRL